ncbi:hypothetical protein K503DRAFT_538833 [Rhizopogon vinicolor AM-OR11-026]|uniref:SH3 domain-containing protein n=1 Tax=Rhizopogon vinicolor AM-OR11-026 TaxID=1314800 RepID=A0A1B7N899_9AGAM|nr:hypothetical protein K503DRAFT_538833 [Rhizopogon vinicolor AM-OR11-026]
MQTQERRSPKRQDTFDLRDQIMTDDHHTSSHMHAHADATNTYAGASDEEHSVLEDDSDGEEREVDYMDEEDDRSSSLSIPNESIDFDLVYSLHSFAATVEGQASVVKGDSLFLMDDSNSYWWLVRVLKTQDVGYIPAENIETPFERLARLNKHRNVDLAHATPQELQEDVERVRNNLSSRAGSHHSPSPTSGFPTGQGKGVTFTTARSVHRYPPAVWHEEEEEEEDVEWDDGAYEEEDPDLAQEMLVRQRQAQMHPDEQHDSLAMQMEPDDGMSWDDGVAEDMQAQNAHKKIEQQMLMTPGALRPGNAVERQQPQIHVQEIVITEQRLDEEEEEPALAQQALHHQSSYDRITVDVGPPSPSSPSKSIDPAEVTETKKLSATPSIAREEQIKPSPVSSGPLLPSAIMQKQEEERKRTREEIEVLEEASKKKLKGKDKLLQPVSNIPVVQKPVQGPGKLRKEQRDTTDDEAKEKKEKKKGGVFGLFGRKKDKAKDKTTSAETASTDTRESQESGRSSSNLHGPGPEPPMSPVTATAMRQQQVIRTSTETRTPTKPQPQQTPQTPPQQVQAQVSQHASQLRQRDQQQQALYHQQYLSHSPSSPPEAPSYGLQSASAMLSSSSWYNTSASSAAGLGLGLPSSRPRPGSLVLSPTADGQGVGVPELSVIRVFAGKHLQTEATFKTVLLNASTTSADLIRQAIQRFRLPTGEDDADYYLTIKQVEGSSAVLLPEEKPLGVFESLVEAAMELPKVKRSSVGSISSISSNLSMHPAIKKLSMNDFSDDSVVKFYLNRRRDGITDSPTTEEGDETIIPESSHDVAEGPNNTSTSGVNVTPDRFSSPSYRFTLQLVVHPEDLPDDMVFDPVTEAIVFKNTLRERIQSTSSISSGVSQNQRRKVFTFPKNVTVAEVIELALERFGILEGVVDGGDEVEDKMTKRRSTTKVRYGLTADVGGQERELSPSSRITEAYARPPVFRRVQEAKRRSIDSAHLLGSMDDVHPDDPVFILRRAISYRTSSSRHRMSAPLDEIALQHFRDSVSGSSLSSDNPAEEVVKPRQLSRQEIIAAQRAASRANQKAILSAQMNSVRGVDVLLPGNAMIRSSRYDSGDKTRYSYVQDGESFDISDIIEQELCEDNQTQKSDLLEGVLGRNKEGMNEKIDRVLNKIKDGRLHTQYVIAAAPSPDNIPSAGSAPSEYSVDDAVTARSGSDGRTPTPLAGSVTGTRRVASPVSDTSRTTTPTPADGRVSRARSTTPSSKPGSSTSRSLRQSSIASVMSEVSTYATPTAQLISPPGTPRTDAVPKQQNTKRPYVPKDDFGVSHMMAIIEIAGSAPKVPQIPGHPVDELLFGKPLDVASLHPEIREIYAGAFQQLDEMDKTLDEYLQYAIGAR